jgi:hypothetical protein
MGWIPAILVSNPCPMFLPPLLVPLLVFCVSRLTRGSVVARQMVLGSGVFTYGIHRVGDDELSLGPLLNSLSSSLPCSTLVQSLWMGLSMR